MTRSRNSIPSYLLHKHSGRGRAGWSDNLGIRRERLLPGAFGSKESLEAKARLELEIVTSPTRSLETVVGISVAEVLAVYLDYAEKYYARPDGTPSKEVDSIKRSIRPVRLLYAALPAAEFSPLKLRLCVRA